MTDQTTGLEGVPEDLPPSAKYILHVVARADGSLLRSDLLEQTSLAERTLDESLARLEEAGLIRRDRDGEDLRFVHIKVEEKS